MGEISPLIYFMEFYRMDIYVGNLSFKVTESELEKVFAKYGTVARAKIITDRDTGRSKGFGFVTFENETSAKEALALNGTNLDNRAIKVDIAVDKPKTERQGGFERQSFDKNKRSY